MSSLKQQPKRSARRTREGRTTSRRRTAFASGARKRFINHPGIDYPLAAVAVVAYLIVVALVGSIPPTAPRDVLLQTFAGITAAALGVAVTAAAIVGSLAPRPRVAELVGTVSRRLGSIVLGSLGALGVTAVFFACLIAVDPSESWPWAVSVGLVALLVLKSGRLAWILSKLFVASAADGGEGVSEGSDAPLDPAKYTLDLAQKRASEG